MKEKIAEEIRKELEQILGEGNKVDLHAITKNNNITQTALLVHRASIGTAMLCDAVYIDEAIDEIEQGETDVETVATDILGTLLLKSASGGVTQSLENMTKESVLASVQYQLINTAENRGRLEEIPHKDFLDMSVVYQIVFEAQGKIFNAMISNKVCEYFHISAGELEEAAEKNKLKCGFSTQNAADILKSMAEHDDWPKLEIPDAIPMLLVLSGSLSFGASIMLHPKFLRFFAAEMQSDLFLLPATTTEVVIGDVSLLESPLSLELARMVSQMPMTGDNRLSDNIYLYRPGTKTTGEAEEGAGIYKYPGGMGTIEILALKNYTDEL